MVDPSETEEAINATAALEDFEAAHDAWVRRECSKLRDLLRARLRASFDEMAKLPSGGVRNASDIQPRADEVMAGVLGFLKHLPKKAMARGVEMSTFWAYPGKVATYVRSACGHLQRLSLLTLAHAVPPPAPPRARVAAAWRRRPDGIGIGCSRAHAVHAPLMPHRLETWLSLAGGRSRRRRSSRRRNVPRSCSRCGGISRRGSAGSDG